MEFQTNSIINLIVSRPPLNHGFEVDQPRLVLSDPVVDARHGDVPPRWTHYVGQPTGVEDVSAGGKNVEGIRCLIRCHRAATRLRLAELAPLGFQEARHFGGFCSTRKM